MATRITEFTTEIGIQGRIGFRFHKRWCSECGNDVPSGFSIDCPSCGSIFDSQQIVHLPPKEGIENGKCN